MELKDVCNSNGLRAGVRYGTTKRNLDPWQQQSHQYTVTLRLKRKSLTVPFFCGRGITEEPTAADVIGCLVMDAMLYDNARDLDDFCAELGYDSDSRKAERQYRECGRMSARVHAFLGDAFDEFASANA